MSDLESRIAGLSPAKRALLERWWSGKLATDETDPIRPRSSDANLPLSFSQQRLWFLDHWEPGNPAYNAYRVFELEGPLDITALQCALTEIASRHESLRTTFLQDQTDPCRSSIHLVHSKYATSPPIPPPIPMIKSGRRRFAWLSKRPHDPSIWQSGRFCEPVYWIYNPRGICWS